MKSGQHESVGDETNFRSSVITEKMFTVISSDQETNRYMLASNDQH